MHMVGVFELFINLPFKAKMFKSNTVGLRFYELRRAIKCGRNNGVAGLTSLQYKKMAGLSVNSFGAKEKWW